MDPCHPSVITNSVILSGGPPIAFIGGGGTVIVSENVNPMTADSGRITLLADGNFETTGLQDELFAVLTFMVTGNPGGIRITFSDAMPGANALVDRSEMTVAASTTGGALQVGGPSTTVPTLSQWGMIAFLSGLVLSAFIFLRRRSTFA